MHELPVLQIERLTVSRVRGGQPLVRDLSLSLHPGECVALVGESGSGKSLTASAVIGLLPKGLAVTEGRIYLQGRDLVPLSTREKRPLRGAVMSLVFQDYQGSFTPFHTVGRLLLEALRTHEKASRDSARRRTFEALESVGLPPERTSKSYPFQLSGGQRQRAALALALLLRPAVLIADEPTTALDPLTQQQVLELIDHVRRETNCAVLLISHDLGAVEKHADRIAVFYGGRLMESGPAAALREHAAHPYTEWMFRSRLRLNDLPERLPTIPGEPGIVAEQGCSFALRCPVCMELCTELPPLTQLGDVHYAACHHLHRKEKGQHDTIIGSA